MPQRLITSTNDDDLLRLVHVLSPNTALTGMAWVPALFECEDDEASGDSVQPSDSPEPTMVYEIPQYDQELRFTLRCWPCGAHRTQ